MNYITQSTKYIRKTYNFIFTPFVVPSLRKKLQTVLEECDMFEMTYLSYTKWEMSKKDYIRNYNFYFNDNRRMKLINDIQDDLWVFWIQWQILLHLLSMFFFLKTFYYFPILNKEELEQSKKQALDFLKQYEKSKCPTLQKFFPEVVEQFRIDVQEWWSKEEHNNSNSFKYSDDIRGFNDVNYTEENKNWDISNKKNNNSKKNKKKSKNKKNRNRKKK